MKEEFKKVQKKDLDLETENFRFQEKIKSFQAENDQLKSKLKQKEDMIK